MDAKTTPVAPDRRRRRARWAAVAGSLAVAGGLAGTAVSAVAAESPVVATATGGAPEQLWSEDYTEAEYEAFWGAGYTWGDAVALSELWSTDELDAKARAGQALLDGEAVPVAPGTSPVTSLEDADPLWSAFAGSGYTYDDAVALAELWGTDSVQAKARIGQAVLDGEELPVAPGSSAPAAG